MTGLSLRTETVDGTLELPGWFPEDDRLFHDRAGRRLWLCQPPARRTWTSTGTLESDAPVVWKLNEGPEGSSVEVEEPAEVDLMELDREAAAAFVDDRSTPMTVLGSFAPIGSAPMLDRFLVGGRVLDTNDFAGRRCPSEQTALALYRIARLRGGAFWDAVAELIAGWTADRFEASGEGLPVHDLWGEGETHARFIADGALLLVAEAERVESPLIRSAAADAVDALERFAVAWGGGTWYVHDSLERSLPRPQLVLNTHVQALITRLAAGRDIVEGLVALEHALRLTGERRRRAVIGSGLVVAALLGARAGGSVSAWADRLASRGVTAAVRSHARRPALRLPGGWIERDVSPKPAGAYYFTVNLYDLAGLAHNVELPPSARRALRSGLRLARAGFFRHQERQESPTAVLHPVILRLAERHGAARRSARRLTASGVSPCLGWPGTTDALFSRLQPGSP